MAYVILNLSVLAENLHVPPPKQAAPISLTRLKLNLTRPELFLGKNFFDACPTEDSLRSPDISTISLARVLQPVFANCDNAILAEIQSAAFSAHV
jgi:hypothetical protein